MSKGSYSSKITLLISVSVLISPIILFIYLSTLNAQNFFSFLLQESYLFPYLIFISIAWFVFTFIFYSLPFLTFKFINLSIEITNDNNIKQNFRLSIWSYLLSICISPIVIFSMIYLTVDHPKYVTLMAFMTFIVMVLLILRYKNNVKIIKIKLNFYKILLYKTISILFLTIGFIIVYSYFSEKKYHLASVPYFLCLSFVLTETVFNFKKAQKALFSLVKKTFQTITKIPYFMTHPNEFKDIFRRKKGNNRITNRDRFIMLLLFSLLIIPMSILSISALVNNLDGEMQLEDAFIPFVSLCLILYTIPNVILLLPNIGIIKKTVYLSLYLIFLSFTTNILNLLAYKTFDSIHFINKNKIEITAKKWHDADTPIPATLNKIQMTAFNAFQTPTHSIFCNYDDIKSLTTRIEFDFFRPEKTPPRCIFVNNDDVNLVEKDKFIKITPTSEEPTLHQYQHL